MWWNSDFIDIRLIRFGSKTGLSQNDQHSVAFSAAHCILPKQESEPLIPRDVLALFGAHDLNNYYEAEKIVLSPKRITIHDEWNPQTQEYDADMSLLEFEKGKLMFSDNSNFIGPICLWGLETEPSAKEGVVVGWGKSDDESKAHEAIPTMIKANIQTNEECFLNRNSLLDLSSFRTFCAGLQNGSGVCFGDSGSGLFIQVNQVYYLKGIVSSSLIKEQLCDVSKNAVYTNVLKYMDWIAEKTRIVLGSMSQGQLDMKPKSFEVFKFSTAFKKVACSLQSHYSLHHRKDIYNCVIEGAIEDENYALESHVRPALLGFRVYDNKNLNFLPRFIGEKFPNLETFTILNCSLQIVRNFYFKDLRKVRFMNLFSNNIASIENGSFDDLVKVRSLHLQYNRIRTVDVELFATMVNLKNLDLGNNQIQFLTPTTFKIPNGKLEKINLYLNVCISKSYLPNDISQLDADLQSKCGSY